MNTQRLSRPSLKISHQTGQQHVGGFIFEVWNPFTGCYQLVDSIQDGLRRIGELSTVICQMWLQRHPKQQELMDAPDGADVEGSEWAEFRINPTTYRSYDTRRHDRPGWIRAVGIKQAVELTCTRVGYAQPTS